MSSIKAKELINILEKHPDWNVTTSIDISTNEVDNDRRAFGDTHIEVINDDNRKQFTICFDGYDNYKK